VGGATVIAMALSAFNDGGSGPNTTIDPSAPADASLEPSVIDQPTRTAPPTRGQTRPGGVPVRPSTATPTPSVRPTRSTATVAPTATGQPAPTDPDPPVTTTPADPPPTTTAPGEVGTGD
jgi:serine/threonine-protein kinase